MLAYLGASRPPAGTAAAGAFRPLRPSGAKWSCSHGGNGGLALCLARSRVLRGIRTVPAKEVITVFSSSIVASYALSPTQVQSSTPVTRVRVELGTY